MILNSLKRTDDTEEVHASKHRDYNSNRKPGCSRCPIKKCKRKHFLQKKGKNLVCSDTSSRILAVFSGGWKRQQPWPPYAVKSSCHVSSAFAEFRNKAAAEDQKVFPRLEGGNGHVELVLQLYLLHTQWVVNMHQGFKVTILQSFGKSKVT